MEVGVRRAWGVLERGLDMAYWLFKSEPEAYSWDELVAEGSDTWDGVRNHQAANNMKAMKRGDRAFFYHSGKTREIVGVVEVVKEYYPDHTDPSGRFGMVDIAAVKPLERPVTLSAVKADERGSTTSRWCATRGSR